MNNLFKKCFAAISAAAMTAVSVPYIAPAMAADADMTSFPFVIEGEDMEGAALWTSIYENQVDGYSGEGFAYLTANPLSFNVTVPEDGMYQVTVRGVQILDKESPRQQTIAVNGVKYTKQVPYYDKWTDIDFGTLRLKAGENEISFIPEYGYMAIDTVTVSEAVFPDVTQATGVPCDPDATTETKALMSYLQSVYGKGILSGQQEIYGGGHSVSTDIRYESGSDKCVDGKGNEYEIDRESEGTDKDGNKFYWHCTDGKIIYTYDEQNRCYKYDYYDQEFDTFKDITGSYPAIRGFDFMNYNPLYGWDDGTTERVIDWVKNRNGIATACWHINLPVDFENYEPGEAVDWSGCSYKNNSQYSIANAVKEGTKENEYLNLAIKSLAEQFLILQENNVPIMFRPFHEAEGNGGLDGAGAWFWWSQDGAEDYKALWKYLYEQLTNEYGLHNIIWLQNLYAWSDDSAQWYAGDEYVDIVGFDKYDTQYNRHDGNTSGPNEDCNSNVYWSLVDYVKNNKMAAIMENSTIPSLTNMTTEKASWLYFCTWYENGQDNFLTGTDYNNAETIRELVESDYAVNLEDLPADLYTNILEASGTTANNNSNPNQTTTTTAAGGEKDDILWGDANCDGNVTIADATAIIQHLGNADEYALSEQGALNADVVDNGDGVTGADANAIQAIEAGFIKQSDLPISKDKLDNFMNPESDTKKLIYEKESDHVVLLSIGDESATDIVIPAEIDGLPVTGIKRGAFCDYTSLESVIIPDGVTRIEDYTFENCNKLTSVTIPDSVTSIGTSAFLSCSSLKSITIPESVTSIENSAFYGCTSLESITIPESVTSIGNGAFGLCSSLKSVTIPDSVTDIGCSVFDVTPWLAAKQEENPLVVVNNILIDGETCSGDVVIPDDVVRIGECAFADCKSLESITILENVVSIGDMAFSKCKSLKKITILNPECDIDISDISNDYEDNEPVYSGTICGYENSTAQAYAEKYGYNFEVIK